MAAAPTEAETAQAPSDASSAAYSRWVMLQSGMEIRAGGSSLSASGASKTLASARTSTGHLIQISLRLKEPPGVSFICLQILDGLCAKNSRVMAAHGDSVLIEVPLGCTIDYFVYSAGATATNPPRPPSMSLLPPSRLGHPSALVLRCEGMVVADLVSLLPEGPDTPELMREADLSVFRSGEWSVKRLQIWFDDASEVPDDPNLWHGVVPIRDGLLCWVDPWELGVVLCNVFDVDETSRLQYVPLPRDNIWGHPSNRNVCATAAGDALKFVNIFPRCCCGRAGACSCERSCNAYTIETWTMRIGDDDMKWVMDGVVDSTELWAHESYKGLRCFPLDHPIVSLDQPEIICFWLHEPPEDGYGRYSDRAVDVLMVNTRSKTIHSVSRYEDGLWHAAFGLIPSNVSYFFNSSIGKGSDATFTRQRQEDKERAQPVIVDDQLIREEDSNGSNEAKHASFTEPSVQASEIFEAFQEIPSYGLDHEELKVYRILSRDNCRLFRSLLRLPKNLRKDWLLMEIKANED